ncbi:MAG TPA: SRPBCC family protein [Mycobacteriales bacterium]|nr:SRPBCC family protein [Mycobacteriales bacterium]
MARDRQRFSAEVGDVHRFGEHGAPGAPSGPSAPGGRCAKMSVMTDKQIEVTTEISADADTLYDMVSDLANMGKWSPEATGGRWLGGGGPAVGAKFLGRNRSGWRRWVTVAKVTEAERGKRFAFSVTSGPLKVADWAYEFVASGGSTKVTETWVDQRSPFMHRLSDMLIGVPDRSDHNRKNMEATLEALKRSAEAAG